MLGVCSRWKEDNVRSIIGGIFKIIGGIAYVGFGIWGLIIVLSIINQAAGFWGVVIGFFIFPVTLVAAPWYALVAWGTWFPLIVVYGGGIGASIFYGLGSVISGD